ncbi:MAG: exosortase [Phycisphaerales bacterium]|nr:MAG: exosortase [Phycisphaerales bacterium]
MKREKTLEKLDIRTVVLVGRHDFGRCALAARLPMALWPIGDKPAVGRLLDHLADEGITRVTICCESDLSDHLDSVRKNGRLEIELLTEDLTCGTAGCLRDAVGADPGELVLLFSGSMASPASIRSMIQAHQDGGAELTMVFNPKPSGAAGHGSPAEIYLCKPDVLSLIPRGGYSDIKEGLIPSILSSGGTVRPLALAKDVGNFHDHKGYLKAAALHLADRADGADDGVAGERVDVAPGASVHPSAKVYGPVVISDHAQVREDAVVVGPAIIGRRAVVGRGSSVVRSVLWDAAEVGAQCEVVASIIDCDTVVPDRTILAEKTVSAGVDAVSDGPGGEATGHRRSCVYRSAGYRGAWLGALLDRVTVRVGLSRRHSAGILGGAAMVAVFLWSYWATFTDLCSVWRRSDEYSAGLLVPFLALYVIWCRRRDFAQMVARPAIIGGVLAFVFAQIVRNLGVFFLYRSAERLSIILSVVALVLLVGGWKFLQKLWPVIIFLCLMMPWPNRVQSAITLPLQRWATTSAVFSLELAGYDVLQDGNIIKIGETSVAVAEACNGLRMITAFFVISGLVVLLARRTWWEKLLVLISSLPIALLCNTLRLAATAIFFTILEGEYWEQTFHDYGGFAMMPLALGMVVGELWLLARLTTPPAETAPAIIARRRPRQVPDS